MATRRERRTQPKIPISTQYVNVSQPERAIGGVAGALMVLFGLRKRSVGGLAMALIGGELIRRGATGHCNVYQVLGIRTAEVEPPQTSGGDVIASDAPEIHVAATIQKPRDEVFRLWRDPAIQREAMSDFAEMVPRGADDASWTLTPPVGKPLRWDSHVVEERPGELVRWETLPGADVPMTSIARFVDAPGGRGTEVHLHVWFVPPGGTFGAWAAERFRTLPIAMLGRSLRRFKSLVETGEIPRLKPEHANPPRALGARLL